MEQTQGIQPSLEVRYDLTKITLLFLSGLAIFVGASWMLSIDPSEFEPEHAWAMPWSAWLTLVALGPMTAILGGKIIDRRPQLRIGPNGVSWRKLWVGQHQFVWSQITDVGIRSVGRFGNGKLLVFTLRDNVRKPRRGIMAWSARLDRAVGYGDIRVGLNGLDHSADEILAAAQHYVNKGG